MIRRLMLAMAVLMLMSAAPAQPTSETTVPVTSFTFTDPVVPPYAGIRATVSGSGISLRADAAEPSNSFGWVEGPLISIPEGDGRRGNTFGVKVEFTHNAPGMALPPTLRLRVNSADFRHFAEAGLPGNRFRDTGGNGQLTVLFDRNQLEEETDFRIFLDLLAVDAVTIDPGFTILINEVVWFVTNSNDSLPGDALFSAVYLETGGTVYAHVGGSSQRIPVRTNSQAFAYDGRYIVVIDSARNLYGFSTEDGFTVATIQATAQVVSAAVSDEHVIFLESNGNVWYYNFVTGMKSILGSNPAYESVSAAGDGTLHVLERTPLGIDPPTFQLLQYDPLAQSPFLTAVSSGYSVTKATTRATGRIDDPQ